MHNFKKTIDNLNKKWYNKENQVRGYTNYGLCKLFRNEMERGFAEGRNELDFRGIHRIFYKKLLKASCRTEGKRGNRKMIKKDNRKTYYMTLDVETTNNNLEDKKHNDGLVYDIGYTIHDRQGNIYIKRSFAVKEIFEWTELMNTAYYKKKLPLYYERLKKGTMLKASIWAIRKEMNRAIEFYKIKRVFAYNALFDKTCLNNTVRYLSASGCRWFFKYGIEFCDTWHVACQVLGLQKTFQWENVRNEKGNLITNAERMFGYCEQNKFFEEEHTGLADAIVETKILARCLKSHKKIDFSINRACWRIPQPKKRKVKDLATTTDTKKFTLLSKKVLTR